MANTWGRAADAEFRDQVSRELATSAQKHEQTAIIQERILGKLERHSEDIRELQQRPAGFRSGLSAYGGCLSMAVAAAIGLVALLISAGGDIIAIYVALHK